MSDSQQTVFLYVPCQMDLFQADTVSSVITVLNRLNQFCHYDMESTCCGRRFFMEGELQYAKELADKVIKSYTEYCVLHKSKFPVVIPDAACAGFMRRHFDLILKNATLPNELNAFVNNVRELCDYIVNVLHIESLNDKFNHRVFYFKSCSAKHLYPNNNAPEILLRNTKGLDLIEDTETKNCCCGANGRFAMLNPDAAEKMTGEIVLRAYNQGAEYITSTDIHCLQLLDAYKMQHNVDVGIIHVADILRGEE